MGPKHDTLELRLERDVDRSQLFGIAMKVCRHRADAEDAVARTLEIFCVRHALIHGDPMPYLSVCCRREALAAIQKRRWAEDLSTLEAEAPAVDHDERIEAARRLRVIAEQCPASVPTWVAHRTGHGTYSQLAADEGVSRHTVNRRIDRVQRALEKIA